MARILITGSSDGLGLLAARSLISRGHTVVLHARNPQRGEVARSGAPGAETCLIADLSSIEETKHLATEINNIGPFDAIIHNAGVGYQEPYRKTVDGLPHVFAINSLAPYILTCLVKDPKRLIYISSGLHTSGDPSLKDIGWSSGRRWNGFQAYSDSKLHNVLLAFAVARRWPKVFSNAVDPGWVATKMGGSGAPDDIKKAVETQVWLAAGEDEAANTTGKYLYHMNKKHYMKEAGDEQRQEEYLKACEAVSGVKFPA